MTITANLTWTASGTDTTYTVFRSTDGGTMMEAYTGPALSFDDATLEPNHVYEYVVEAENEFGASASNQVSADTRPPTAAVLYVSVNVAS